MSVQKQIDQLIAYQAAEWFELMRCEGDKHSAAFVRWIAESPRHMEAFLAIASEAAAMRVAFAKGSFDLETLLRKVSPQPSRLPLSTIRNGVALAHRSTARRRTWLAIAAAIVIAVGVAAKFVLSPWQRFETPLGEQRAIPLADGSVVNLNASSRLEVRFSNSDREIRLLSGEAMFKVAPDRTRPFQVRTADAVVQAVGTQFNVYARPNGTTTVSVLEGKVQVRSKQHASFTASQNQAPTALAAGEEVSVATSGGIKLHPDANVADAVAWQQRKLIFKHTALEDIVMEFNRYNKSLQIRLQDIEPGAFLYTGAFDADDPLSLAALLARETDLFVQRREGEIIVRRRPHSSKESPSFVGPQGEGAAVAVPAG